MYNETSVHWGTRQRINRRIVQVASLVLLAWLGSMRAHTQSLPRFVSGVPTLEGETGDYPVYLYAVGPRQTLSAERLIMDGHQGLFDVRDDQHGTMYILSTVDRLAVINEADPQTMQTIDISAIEGDNRCWGAVAGGLSTPAAVLCWPR